MHSKHQFIYLLYIAVYLRSTFMDIALISLPLLSFISGVLTILAPCVLPLLPLFIGTSIQQKNRRKWVRVILSFGISVLLFSLAINRISTQRGIYQEDIRYRSGRILLLIGIGLAFPTLRDRFISWSGMNQKISATLRSTQASKWKDIITGIMLWPLLQSCSPTYGILLSIIIPANFSRWLINIIMYVIGLMTILFIIVYASNYVMKVLSKHQRTIAIIKQVAGWIIILVGLTILFGVHKDISIRLIEQGWGIDTSWFENTQLQNVL